VLNDQCFETLLSSHFFFSTFLFLSSHHLKFLSCSRAFFDFEEDSSQSDKLASFKAPVLQFYTVRQSLSPSSLRSQEHGFVGSQNWFETCWQNRFDTWRRDYVWVRENSRVKCSLRHQKKRLIGQIHCILTIRDSDVRDEKNRPLTYCGVLWNVKRPRHKGVPNEISGMIFAIQNLVQNLIDYRI
jgi:hypothetical protein